ncbi:hypothetical protein T492DRAFT_1135860 [Pavlovales sp. CCMP2436]|nr:hypothetical protein T492DRAFT_1135860 [Pavlovales sp. CCMP2436]
MPRRRLERALAAAAKPVELPSSRRGGGSLLGSEATASTQPILGGALWLERYLTGTITPGVPPATLRADGACIRPGCKLSRLGRIVAGSCRCTTPACVERCGGAHEVCFQDCKTGSRQQCPPRATRAHYSDFCWQCRHAGTPKEHAKTGCRACPAGAACHSSAPTLAQARQLAGGEVPMASPCRSHARSPACSPDGSSECSDPDYRPGRCSLSSSGRESPLPYSELDDDFGEFETLDHGGDDAEDPRSGSEARPAQHGRERRFGRLPPRRDEGSSTGFAAAARARLRPLLGMVEPDCAMHTCRRGWGARRGRGSHERPIRTPVPKVSTNANGKPDGCAVIINPDQNSALHPPSKVRGPRRLHAGPPLVSSSDTSRGRNSCTRCPATPHAANGAAGTLEKRWADIR